MGVSALLDAGGYRVINKNAKFIDKCFEYYSSLLYNGFKVVFRPY